ncbi:hypothetical protein [Mesorhizobium sp.]|uniref:hypothetical protein n=1 Tax=Mesorhizobium sp. TaxID=1871066 RepID=UPI000FE55F2A|nr:hypothetical protein [Mesorhizobium sp.]RWM84324.1 MAG: hypothetical protein EOR83_17030 [Mesorhizobium sp.]
MADLPTTEFDEGFVQGMRDRTAVSFFKYGPLANAVANKADFITALVTRLEKYKETGNTEWLMDVANYAMFEAMYPSHRNAHFRATDSDESPGKAPERKRVRPV